MPRQPTLSSAAAAPLVTTLTASQQTRTLLTTWLSSHFAICNESNLAGPRIYADYLQHFCIPRQLDAKPRMQFTKALVEAFGWALRRRRHGSAGKHQALYNLRRIRPFERTGIPTTKEVVDVRPLSSPSSSSSSGTALPSVSARRPVVSRGSVIIHEHPSETTNQKHQTVIDWLHANFVAVPTPREGLLVDIVYEQYTLHFCIPSACEPMRRMEFGKVIRMAFPSLKKNRLGSAGAQMAYYNITHQPRCPFGTGPFFEMVRATHVPAPAPAPILVDLNQPPPIHPNPTLFEVEEELEFLYELPQIMLDEPSMLLVPCRPPVFAPLPQPPPLSVPSFIECPNPTLGMVMQELFEDARVVYF
jgi:hypothetical protein